MLVVRPLQPIDADIISSFSNATSFGMISLPQHPPRLARMLANGLVSFHSHVTAPGGEVYPFLLEDTETKAIVGTSSIVAHASGLTPFCTFGIESHGSVIDGLQLRIYHNGPSQLCGLYLLPGQRGSGLGLLLSLSRLLFIAAHPHRFTDTLTADMRGHITPDGVSPFWEAVGAHYYGCSFRTILERLDREEVSLCDHLPKTLIPWNTLSPEVQAIVGTTHPHTQPAWRLLTREGLLFQDEVGALDAGPFLSGKIATLHTVLHSHRVLLTGIADTLGSDAVPALLSNDGLADFRACRSTLTCDDSGHVTVDYATADALQLEVGSPLRYRLLERPLA